MSHHYGEDSTTFSQGSKNIIIRFQNKETKAVVKVVVPRRGALARSKRARHVAPVEHRVSGLIHGIAAVLRRELE